MKSMGVNEIREKFLSFFESKGCLRLGSFPLIPKNDASLLLINSGMAPMKPWFQNPETAPKRRVTTCQKCIRTGDIENVGKTARHGTFFEMLGNFSFGDYFKKEATAWAWEFFTKVMEIPQERLWISVYEEDDEARDIWVNEVGVDPAHIVKLGKEDNFWEHGTGPCGPCSEIYFDRGEEYCMNFLLNLGIRKENLRFRDHSPEELAFYSNATADIEFVFPFGWGELWGIADRTDYDLKQHMEHSGESMEYMDPITNEKYVPYCIEPSLGADRVALAFLVEAYDEEELEGGDTRVVMHLHPALAPIKAAVLPLSKKLDEGATAVYEQLSKKFNCEYDNAGSIGKRYRRQDEIGTPYCITYDFDSAEDNSVTVRDRDTMEQQRIKIDELEKFLEGKLEF